MQRQCELLGIPEETDLSPGLDFRLPQYRREVFLRFYEFHTKYNAHPGAVYYAMPYLFQECNMSMEEKLWFCYINGLSQNVLTTFEIWLKFPTFSGINLEALSTFFRSNYSKFGWDTDRRYVKNSFEKCVESYIKVIGGKTQEEYFMDVCDNVHQGNNFNDIWTAVFNNFYLFGRLSTFSYLEYLKIAGLPIECTTLFIYDIDGSKSHRNGLCKVLGRDDLDWHDKLNPDFKDYTKGELNWLEDEGEKLLFEASKRFEGTSYFTLESTLCCYKSWHRPNRRYPNVYNDMFYERILVNERNWGRRNELFRCMRQDCLPKHLRIEDNPGDVGLNAKKQNHYLLTGQVIMMDTDYPCFKNDYNDNLKNKKHEGVLTNGSLW